MTADDSSSGGFLGPITDHNNAGGSAAGDVLNATNKPSTTADKVNNANKKAATAGTTYLLIGVGVIVAVVGLVLALGRRRG
jgi:hypothetical protein